MIGRLFTPEHKRVILFDMHHTLVNPESNFQSALSDMLQAYTARYSDPAAGRRAFQTYQEEWRKRLPHRKPSQSLEQLRLICLQIALKPLPLPKERPFVRMLYTETREHEADHPHLIPGVRDTLTALSKRYQLGIISNNKHEDLQQKIAKLDLQPLIPASRIFATNKQAMRKPNPDLFQHALQQMNIKPEQAIMVGDNWQTDIVGAIRSGMDAIWINPKHSKRISQRRIGARRVLIVRNMTQLTHLLR